MGLGHPMANIHGFPTPPPQLHTPTTSATPFNPYYRPPLNIPNHNNLQADNIGQNSQNNLNFGHKLPNAYPHSDNSSNIASNNPILAASLLNKTQTATPSASSQDTQISTTPSLSPQITPPNSHVQSQDTQGQQQQQQQNQQNFQNVYRSLKNKLD